MTKAEQKKLDKMLDRWAEEDRKYGRNTKPISDPKPGWDHRAYLDNIYCKGLNK